jgi:hypothetical protein
MSKAADDYSSRAATFRRLAAELRDDREQAALLAIADQYDAVAARLASDEGEDEEA